MTDIASLSLEVKTDSLKQATAALRDLPVAASAAERAAKKWGTTMDANARSADDFSKRVQRTINDLQFQQQQLSRTSAEQERFTALRRAGVSASSAEGQAISASVQALQAQKAALADNATVVERVRSGWDKMRGVLLSIGAIALAQKLIEIGKAAFEAAAGLQELAEQSGVTVKGLQALQYQAVQNGVGMEQLETGLSKFSQKIGEAATGSKPMLDSLDALGVKILDANGNLRPTEALLQDVAKAILSISDPAKQSAASVDFFGKAGTRFLPLLGEMAKGVDSMAAATQRAGAIIGDETVTKLDKLSDRMAANRLVFRANFAEGIATLDDWRNAFNKWAEDLGASLSKWASDQGATIKGWLDSLQESLSVGGARASAGFLAVFQLMPETLGKLFVDAWNTAGQATVSGINKLTGDIVEASPDWLKSMLGISGGTDFKFSPAAGGGASLTGLVGGITAAANAAEVEARKQFDAAKSAAAADVLRNRQAQAQADEAAARIGKLGVVGAPGKSNPPATGSGKEAENQEKAYQKLTAQLEATAKAQDLMTAASAKGDVQFEAVKIHLEAQQKALEIYGKALDDNDPKLVRIEGLLRRIAEGKAAEAFNVATTELQKQNVILQAQIDLMGQAPEIQAREIALIKAKQEAEKAGTAVTQDMIDARTKAIEQNETLKIQQEELKRAQDLWTEPLKRALGDIQSTAADAFEQMLTSGNFTFQSLADSFKKVIVKMIAEFLALATVRPVMTFLVNAVGGGGLASQMGLGTGNTAGGGGGLGSLFGGSGGGGGGGIGSIFENMFNVPQMGPLQPGAAALPGTSIFNPALGTQMGSFGLGNLGGALGIGMGAMSLLNGGTKTTAGTIGGIGSMIGGGLMMIPTPWTMAAGAAISLLSNVLPGLLGGSKPAPPINRTNAQLQFGSGGAFTTGSAFGPDANSTDAQNGLAQIGQSMQSVFDLFGGLKDATKAWGIASETISQKSGDGTQEGWDFTSTSNFLTGPGGQKELFRMNETGMDDKAAAYALYRSIEGGAVGAISANMKQAFNTAGATQSLSSVQAITTTVQQIMAFDEAVAKFGKDVAPGEDAIKQVDDSFQGLYDTIKQYNLAASETAKVDAEKLRQEQKVTGDFTYSITQALLGFTDPTTAAMNDIAKERTANYANNAAFLKTVVGYTDQASNIEALYQQKRLKIMADANAQAVADQQAAAAAQKQIALDLANSIGQSVARVQDLIDQLSPGGALGNVDPATQLAALKASYSASLAQALSDPTNDTLIQKAVADAQAFTETSLKYNAGDSNYERDRQNALAQLQALQQATTGAGLAQSTDPDIKNLLQKIAAAVSEPTNDNAKRDADLSTVLALLARFLVNGKTAA